MENAKTVSTVIHPRVTDLATLLAWFASRTRTPTYQDVMTRFECSRPTAFRWLGLYRHLQAEKEACLAAGQPPARNLRQSQPLSAAESTQEAYS